MEKINYKKKLQHLYKPSVKEVEIVEVPQMNFLMIDGDGGPNHPTFQNAIEVLFPLLACPPKVVPSVKLVFVQTERNKEYDT